jgi:solute carrier family 25 (mitochondrial carnitine/acylcarnitine transporter), member 20/29
MSKRVLTAPENAVLGCAAGTIEVTILQPMLYLKNATQQGLPMTLDPRLLYRGLFASVMNMSILTGLQFPLTGLVSGAITGGAERRLTDGEMIGSGFVGGALSGFACGPMELVMIQQQRFGGGILATPPKIMADHGGARALFRSVSMACGREGLFAAGYLGIGPVLSRRLVEDHGLADGTADVAGAVGAGVIAASLSHPMDTIKTCMQGDLGGARYGGVGATGRTLMAESGVGAFFRGWSWRTGRMICAVFIMGQCKKQLTPILFPDPEGGAGDEQ